MTPPVDTIISGRPHPLFNHQEQAVPQNNETQVLENVFAMARQKHYPTSSFKFMNFMAYALCYTISQAFLVYPAVFTDTGLDLTDSEYSFYASLFYLVYGSLQFPLGLLADRFSSKKTVGVLFPFIILGCFLALNPSNYLVLCLSRVFMACGASSVYISASRVFPHFYLEKSIPFLTSVFFAFSSIGTLFMSSVLPSMYSTTRDALIVCLTLQILFYILFITVVREPIVTTKLDLKQAVASTIDFFKTTDGKILCFNAFSTYAPWSAVAGLMINRYLTYTKCTTQTITMLTALYSSSMFYGGQIVGYLSRFINSSTMNKAMHALGAVFLFAQGWISTPGWMFYIVFFMHGAIGGSACVPVYGDVSILASAKSSTIGIISTVAFIGSALLQMGVGKILSISSLSMDDRYSATFFLMAAIYFVGLLFLSKYKGVRSEKRRSQVFDSSVLVNDYGSCDDLEV
ncbi:hypothetical protein PCE1_003359 [Barthelona sp. PCE]